MAEFDFLSGQPLSDRLRKEVTKAGNKPVRLTDPDTQEEYVVLRAAVFRKKQQKLRAETVDPSLYEFEETEKR